MKKNSKAKMRNLVVFSCTKCILGQEIDWQRFQTHLTYLFYRLMIIDSNFEKKILYKNSFGFLSINKCRAKQSIGKGFRDVRLTQLPVTQFFEKIAMSSHTNVETIVIEQHIKTC